MGTTPSNSRRGSRNPSPKGSKFEDDTNLKQDVISDDRGSRRTSTVERKVVKTEEEWQQQLTSDQYALTRQKQDDGKGGKFADLETAGVYLCVCCDEPLFDSCKKFASPDGRPAFFNHLGMVITREAEEKAEVCCNRCGAYLGYCLNSGPPPSNKHFSIHSEAIKFIVAHEEEISGQAGRLDIQSPAPPTVLKAQVDAEFKEVTGRLEGKKKVPGLSINPSEPTTVPVDIRTMFQSPAPVRTKQSFSDQAIVQQLDALRSPPRGAKRSEQS